MPPILNDAETAVSEIVARFYTSPWEDRQFDDWCVRTAGFSPKTIRAALGKVKLGCFEKGPTWQKWENLLRECRREEAAKPVARRHQTFGEWFGELAQDPDRDRKMAWMQRGFEVVFGIRFDRQLSLDDLCVETARAYRFFILDALRPRPEDSDQFARDKRIGLGTMKEMRVDLRYLDGPPMQDPWPDRARRTAAFEALRNPAKPGECPEAVPVFGLDRKARIEEPVEASRRAPSPAPEPDEEMKF